VEDLHHIVFADIRVTAQSRQTHIGAEARLNVKVDSEIAAPGQPNHNWHRTAERVSRSEFQKSAYGSLAAQTRWRGKDTENFRSL
jgi:hypothetical protein